MTSRKFAIGISSGLVAIMGVVGGTKYVHADNAAEAVLDARQPAYFTALGEPVVDTTCARFNGKAKFECQGTVQRKLDQGTRDAFAAADAAFDADWNNWPLRPVPATETVLKQRQKEEVARQAELHKFLPEL